MSKLIGHRESSARRKYIAATTYIKKDERTQISKLTFSPKQLEKKNKLHSKLVEEKVTEVRAEINKIETR